MLPLSGETLGGLLAGVIQGTAKTYGEKVEGGFEQISVKGVSGKVEVACTVSLDSLKLSDNDEKPDRRSEQSRSDRSRNSNSDSDHEQTKENLLETIDDLKSEFINFFGKPAFDKILRLDIDVDYLVSEMGLVVQRKPDHYLKQCLELKIGIL